MYTDFPWEIKYTGRFNPVTFIISMVYLGYYVVHFLDVCLVEALPKPCKMKPGGQGGWWVSTALSRSGYRNMELGKCKIN